MTTRRIFDSGFSTSALSKFPKTAREARVPIPLNKNKILFGPTSDLLDNTLRKIPWWGNSQHH